MFIFNTIDILQGHDPLDSTTVRDTPQTIQLAEEGSVEGLHIGIPKVFKIVAQPGAK